MANITKITIEGFGSVVEKIKYKFDRPGLNIITGKNGSGKTTILNALYYGFYGQTLKPKSSVLPWPQVIGDSPYRGLHISIQLDEYTIHRCLEYKGKVLGKKGGNRLVIEKQGIEVSSLRGKVDAQKWINDQVGYSALLFKTSILLAQELNSLLDEDGPTKKKTFDEAFASAFINRAKETAEHKLKTLQDEHKELSQKHEAKLVIRNKCSEILQQLVEANRNFAIEKARSISDLRRKVRDQKKTNLGRGKKKHLFAERKRIKAEIKENEKKLEDLRTYVNPRLRDEEFQLMLDVNRYSDEIEKLKQRQELIKYQINKPAKCEECGSNLKGKHKAEHKKRMKDKFTELKKQEREVEKSLIFTRNRHEATKKQLDDQMDFIKELDHTKAKIQGLNKELHNVGDLLSYLAIGSEKIRNLKKEISRIRRDKKKNDTSKLEADINTLSQEIVYLDIQVEDLQKKIELQLWLIKDPLSNSGLKAFIFDSMLRKTNHYLKHYTNFIGFKVEVGIDLQSANKDFLVTIHKDSKEVPYADLSKGQKQLTKAVLCFALNKTLQGSKPLNILLLDELFESLDPENVEIIGNIIQSEAKTKCVHLITHHPLFNPPNCYKIFITQNTKGQTFIEQKYKEA